jgi:hypothetical protein
VLQLELLQLEQDPEEPEMFLPPLKAFTTEIRRRTSKLAHLGQLVFSSAALIGLICSNRFPQSLQRYS